MRTGKNVDMFLPAILRTGTKNYYLFHLLVPRRDGSIDVKDMPIEYVFVDEAQKGAQRLFDGNIGLIYPDFISRDTEAKIIADAKYKPIDNIGNRDYLQVLAYMFRFDAKAGYYLYPDAVGIDDSPLWMNKGSTYESNVTARDDICVTKHGLKIPVDAENYDAFVSQMKISEATFREAFTG